MAILKMKKLSVTVISSQKRELLKRLIRLGCVQLDEQELCSPEDGGGPRLSHVESSLVTFKSEWNRLIRAIGIIDKRSPEKTALLSPMPEVSGDVLLDEANLDALLKTAEEIIGADDMLRKISADESRQRALIESLRPWHALPLRLESDGTLTSSVIPGTLSARTKLPAVEAAIAEVTELAELIPMGEDYSRKYVLLVCLREKLAAVQDELRGWGFQPVLFPGLSGTAKECVNAANTELNRLGDEYNKCCETLDSLTAKRNELKLAADRYEAKIAMAEAEEKLLATESTLFLSGWVPEENETALAAALEDFICAWTTEDPAEEEYPQVPVKLKNNRITNGLNMVTNMYSLPMYGTVDPNPLMAPFFILFYGLMMADMGYGIIMIVAALVAMKKMQPKEGSLSFCQLLLWCGISTFAMGALTGGFFSDIPLQLYQLFNPGGAWQGLPYLFSPVYQSETVLYGSMVLGALHLNAGMVVSFVQKVKAGQLQDAIWEEGSLWVLLVGGVLAVLKVGTVSGFPIPLAVGLAMLLFGAGRSAKGFGKVTAAFACIYNTATGWFGDVLSYSRIMALMLAGGVVGQVFNTVAVMPMKSSGVNPVTVAAFVVIFLLGHAMNFGLNILGCYVHDLRLQCLEFFGKFYVDGGRAFRPLKFGGKYVRAKEN